MREFVVKVVDINGRVLRRTVVFAKNGFMAARRGYELAAETHGADDVLVCPV